VIVREYTALFPFGGAGGGALGFMQAEARLLERVARFRILGSLDFDALACADFERFVGAPAWCTDIQRVTYGELLARYGLRAPDVVFLSPPCKGSSRLLSSEKAKTEKYQAMNRLAVVWTRVMLEAWGDAPPSLILLENVPGLPQRAGAMLRELRSMLKRAGYVFHASAHDCGELGGLAQHRERYLLVARHTRSCSSLLYKPQHRRVRGVGEVLSDLPMPATVAAAAWGALHTMPKLTWRNWLRLALIPAGGDWRDLDGVLQGRARREVFRRHAVQRWDEAHPVVTGSGGHSVEAVSDPRITTNAKWHAGAYGVRAWDEASGAITGGADHPSRGVFAVADPRISIAPSESRHSSKFGVVAWDDASPTVIGKPQPSSGMAAVADLRVTTAYDRGYSVLRWDEPSPTVAGGSSVGQGAYAVADARERLMDGARILSLDEAMALDLPPEKAPPFVPVIVAEDGTWHRPMTLLELSALQGYPLRIDGKPIPWAGTRTQVAEHVGNSVPPPSARAIAEQMLITLVASEAGSWIMGTEGVWVSSELHA
jgi:site-specific DNA-cytosine methylase